MPRSYGCRRPADLPDGRDVDAVRVDPSAEPQDGPDGTVVVDGALLAAPDGAAPWPCPPLGRAAAPAAAPTGIVLVPYHSWAQERGPSTMRVWLPPAGGPQDA